MNHNPSMHSSSHVETVQSMYAAFGRGDVASILARLHPEVDWRINVDPAAPGVAHVAPMRPCRGNRSVPDFFAALARDLDFHVFEPRLFLTAGHSVASRVRIEWTHRGTKKRFAADSLHLFTFDAAGKLTEFREFTDTLGVAASYDAVRST